MQVPHDLALLYLFLGQGVFSLITDITIIL